MPSVGETIDSKELVDFMTCSAGQGFGDCQLGYGTRPYGDQSIGQFAVCYPEPAKSSLRVKVCYRLHEYQGEYKTSIQRHPVWRWQVKWLVRDFGIIFENDQ